MTKTMIILVICIIGYAGISSAGIMGSLPIESNEPSHSDRIIAGEPGNEVSSFGGTLASNLPRAAGDPHVDTYAINFTSQSSGVVASLTTAYYNSSSHGFELNATRPYPASKTIVSPIVILTELLATGTTATVNASLPFSTSVQIYVTNDNFRSEVFCPNASFTTFPEAGRQITYKIVLGSTDPDQTPTIYGIQITVQSAAPTVPPCTPQYARTGRANNAQGFVLGVMNFTFSAQLMQYELSFEYFAHDINSTHDYFTGEFSVKTLTSSFVTWQDNFLVYDISCDINCVNYRWYASTSDNTGPFATATILSYDVFNITMAHGECEVYNITSSVSFHLWNGNGGDLQGTTPINCQIYWYCAGTIAGGFLEVCLFALAAIGASILRFKRKRSRDPPTT